MSSGFSGNNSGSDSSLVRLLVEDIKSETLSAGQANAALRPVDKTLLCRFELKYRISEMKAAAAAEFVRHHLKKDYYCINMPGGRYPIVSLYFDSSDFTLCRETMGSKKNRFKLRIRSYSDDPDADCFAEIKRRINNAIFKSRARIKRSEIASVIRHRRLASREYKKDEDALQQFQMYMRSINAGPLIQVRYDRQAYEGECNNRVRVTFDRNLCYRMARGDELTLKGRNWSRCPVDFVILEIKFNACYPAWLGRMVKMFDLDRSAISKYISSLTHSCTNGFCMPDFWRYY